VSFLRYSMSKNVATLKSGSEVLKVIERDTILYIRYDFLLVFYRNFVLNTHRF